MDFVVRRHTHYRELVSMGVRCGRLHSSLQGQNSWHLQCFFDEGLIDKEKAKRMVADYICLQWEGGLIRFYVKHGARAGEFWCAFVSWAL